MNVKDDEIQKILTDYKSLVVYGLSPDPSKASHEIPVYMRSKDYDVVGTYPRGEDVDGFKIYKNLSEVPLPYRKFVDVFRRSESIPEVVEEVLAVGGVEVLWLQLGISHPAAERKAEAAGIRVVSDRCLLVEHRKRF